MRFLSTLAIRRKKPHNRIVVALVTISSHENLRTALQALGYYLPAACGGRGTCGKCAVRIVSGSVLASDADRARFSPAEIEDGWRLACAAFPAGEITVEIPESAEENFCAVDSFEPAQSMPYAENVRDEGMEVRSGAFGIAVDIGTTTIGCALIDLSSGRIAARYSTLNRQREYGADVISRIQSANAGNLLRLSRIVRGQISEGIRSLCASAAVDSAAVEKIAVAGNTTMIHIFLNLSCQTLGQAPFAPLTLDMVIMPYREIFNGELNCDVVILPGISAYVGADIVSGIFFTELHASAAPAVLLDIGTNGELALAYEGKILCTATAAGPAFEAGNILWGTGSVAGAISHARFRNGAFEIDTIDNRPPLGICGSGVIDVVYQGLANGLILHSGRFATDTAGGIVLAKAPDGRNIVFCQKDVRELQLAKSAIRTGLDALLNHAGLAYNDIQTVYIAGGFGFNLNMESAAGIGLVPAPLVPKVSLVGNSALGGAVKYLLGKAGCDEQLSPIIRQSSEFNLPEDKYFSTHFIDNINFE